MALPAPIRHLTRTSPAFADGLIDAYAEHQRGTHPDHIYQRANLMLAATGHNHDYTAGYTTAAGAIQLQYRQHIHEQAILARHELDMQTDEEAA